MIKSWKNIYLKNFQKQKNISIKIIGIKFNRKKTMVDEIVKKNNLKKWSQIKHLSNKKNKEQI
jgi:hypothetical protein